MAEHTQTVCKYTAHFRVWVSYPSAGAPSADGATKADSSTCCCSAVSAALQEKIERAENYARVMRELSQLGQFVRLADYLFVEAVMATAVANVEELLGVLTAHKQQVSSRAFGTMVGFVSCVLATVQCLSASECSARLRKPWSARCTQLPVVQYITSHA